jgi:hypothetical protein
VCIVLARILLLTRLLGLPKSKLLVVLVLLLLQAVAANAALYQVGNAFEEGSLRPQSLIINPVRITNYTQIFRNTWAISDTIRATMMIAGDTNIQESRQDCAGFHAADIEKGIFFGQKSNGTRNGQPFRTMDGLINIVGTLSYYPAVYYCS